MSSYTSRESKSDVYALAQTATKSGTPAHVQEIAGRFYIVLLGVASDTAYEPHGIRRLMEGEVAEQITDHVVAAIYYARTGRHLSGDKTGEPVLSEDQIKVIDALLRWF